MNKLNRFVQIVLLLLLLWGAYEWWAKYKSEHVPKPQPQTAYDPHQVCPVVWDKNKMSENDHSKEDIPYFDVQLADGCFSGFVHPPDAWGSWDWEFVSRESNRYYAFWFLNREYAIGPFLPNQHPDLRYHPRAWRMQGIGTMRFFRTDRQ